MGAQNQSELGAELKTWVNRLCQKNFGGAGELLREAAERKAKQLNKVRKELEQLTEETVSSFRLAGDAHSNNYAFGQALEVYERALEYVSRELTPHLWAVVVTQVGKAYHELGIRIEGVALHYHFSAAVESYRRALEVQTQEHLLQDWARTQTHLGTALREQGVRLGGEAGWRLLEKAVAAYRQALEVQTRRHLPQDWAWTQTHLGTALREQGVRLGGEAGQRLLEEAIAAYRRALEIQTQGHLPQDWARTQTHLGTALREQGVRLEGEAGQQLLAEAIASYRRALEVQTRGELSQDWAWTQTHLGTALGEQGVRIEGEAGWQLLEEAVIAYRQALEVQTRGHLPQDWAWTQTHLGTALGEQGVRLGGEAGQRLLEEAIASYQGALEVQTPETLPGYWIQAQYHLAQTHLALETWSEAAASFARLLQVSPDNGEAYYAASVLYHEKLLAFEEAFSLSQQWLNSHPEDLEAHSQLAEQCFTTGRFAEAVEHFARLLANPELDPQIKIPLQAFEIAALLGLNQKAVVPQKFKGLCVAIAHQPEDFSLEWTFGGSKYFIAQAEQLSPYRAWLLELFAALEEKNRNAILSCLGEDVEQVSSTAQSQPS
ncbi:Tetratricopeptide domain protein [Nitrosococcus halophilus Nc 4]|uniref:Tetratricopeptide domain protein n=1 Tax=Nitrosococcus halophilus (strain Nc4) TaxID=472759 RepID=D5BVL5_NITHN|nr:hypothetical protein [Nitrosococcus halophilus]ADE13643.1 Tetratricopeptide domain protein [Nitrosococcus halophilus Nc 4]